VVYSVRVTYLQSAVTLQRMTSAYVSVCFLDLFKMCKRMRAYRIIICYSYARHTLDIHTTSIRCFRSFPTNKLLQRALGDDTARQHSAYTARTHSAYTARTHSAYTARLRRFFETLQLLPWPNAIFVFNKTTCHFVLKMYEPRMLNHVSRRCQTSQITTVLDVLHSHLSLCHSR